MWSESAHRYPGGGGKGVGGKGKGEKRRRGRGAKNGDTPKKDFSIDGFNCLLTYAQTPFLGRRALLERILQNDKERSASTGQLLIINRLMVCEELHQDGNPHYHVYVEFFHRVRLSNIDIFVIPYGKRDYRPNVSVPRGKGDGKTTGIK